MVALAFCLPDSPINSFVPLPCSSPIPTQSPSASRPPSTENGRAILKRTPDGLMPDRPSFGLGSSPKISPPCWSPCLFGCSLTGSRARVSVRPPGGGRVVRQHSVKVVALLVFFLSWISTAHSQWFACWHAFSTRTGPWVLCFVFWAVFCRFARAVPCRMSEEIFDEMLSLCPICFRSLFALRVCVSLLPEHRTPLWRVHDALQRFRHYFGRVDELRLVTR